jgi:hypothetical protein
MKFSFEIAAVADNGTGSIQKLYTAFHIWTCFVVSFTPDPREFGVL